MITANEHRALDRDALFALTRTCQLSFAAWQDAVTISERELLRAEHRAHVEHLWDALQPELHGIARRWRRSGMAPDVQSLAMSMFVAIITVLPTLDIDPAGNVRGLLLTIVQRHTIDEYRKHHRIPPRRRPAAAHDGTWADGRMWPGEDHVAAGSAIATIADPASYDTDSIASRVDHEHLLRAIWDYWPGQLSPLDFQIVQLRWQSEPPMHFIEIARLFGSGWEESAVRQRHHRILKETRQFLRSQGLLE